MAKQYRPIDELVLKDDYYFSSHYTTTYNNTFFKGQAEEALKSPAIGRR
jgi:hypothetical protein